MLRTILIWSFIAGFIMVGSFHLMNLTTDALSGDHSLGYVFGFGSMIIAYSTTYFAVRKVRSGSKRWNFGKAWGTGLSVLAISSVIYVVGWIQFSANHPGVMDGYFEAQIQQYQIEFADQPEVLAQKVAEAEQYKIDYTNNEPWTWAMTYMEPLPVGLLFTLIIAALLRKPFRIEE